MRDNLILVFCIFLLPYILGHVPSHVSTPKSKVDQHCELADSCIHDAIAVCGMMDKEKRSFLDICDLIEYVCDHNVVFTHVDDMPDCPKDIKAHRSG